MKNVHLLFYGVHETMTPPDLNSSSVNRVGDEMKMQPMDPRSALETIHVRPQIELVFDASGSSTGDCTKEYLQKLNNLVLEK